MPVRDNEDSLTDAILDHLLKAQFLIDEKKAQIEQKFVSSFDERERWRKNLGSVEAAQKTVSLFIEDVMDLDSNVIA